MMGKKISSGGLSTKARSLGPGASSLPRSNSKSSTSGSAGVGGGGGASGSQQDVVDGPVVAHIKSQDNFKLLPRYSAALGRPHDDSMPAEDLDAIQLELELLLSTVAQRARAIRHEASLLDRGGSNQSDDVPAPTPMSRRDAKKGKYLEKQPNSPGKRKRGLAANDEKKLKDKYIGSTHKVAKLKHSSSSATHSPIPGGHLTDDSMDGAPYLANHTLPDNPKVHVPKNDVPNKFWLSVEPYCMPISHEDIKLLDDLLEEYSGALVPAIPDLGPHYSSQWAAEDLKEEQDSSNPNAKANKRFTSGNSVDVTSMMKKSEKLLGDQVTGPLTQRLMAAFLEENVMPPSNNSDPDDALVPPPMTTSAAATNNQPPHSADPFRAIKNGVSLERRVKQELIDQGLMSADDFAKDDDNDEILAEIVRVRTELSTIAEYNYKELQKLLDQSKNEMKRLEVKRQLDVVDQEIVEMYKRVAAIKKKRRALTEPERSEVFRLTEEQKRLSDLLESFNSV